jgi:hypothetical protein
MRKLILAASLLSFGLTLTAMPARTATLTPQSENAQKAQTTAQSAVGKVTAIGSNGHSFTIANGDDSKQTMDFVIDQNTKVEGHVHVGTTVTVAYAPKDGGPNVAITVTAQA